jgi:hypothetical protein
MCAMRLFGLFVTFSLFASTATLINFDTAPLGRTPPGWSTSTANNGGAPRWEILRDLSAPTQPYVLAPIPGGGAQSRSPLAILDTVSLRDADLSVRIKPVAGSGIPGGGLIWRYRDENNYYLVRTNASDNTVAVYKVENGQPVAIHTGAHRDIPLNGWSILKVAARGNRFQVYVDHRRILEGRDSTFMGAGKVGLWTVADAVTYFDDFRVYPK